MLCWGFVCQWLGAGSVHADTFASANAALDSPVYSYLEKLSGFGLVTSDMKGIRPYTKSAIARLITEAERSLAEGNQVFPALAEETLAQARQLVDREYQVEKSGVAPPLFWGSPLASTRIRYVYLHGTPRSYERAVHDPGNDGVFGIGSGLRPANPFPFLVQQHGTEGTPLFENNEGVRYGSGSNLDMRFSSEGGGGRYVSLLLEPQLVYQESTDAASLALNKAYLKIGSGPLELEVGRDAAWLGPGSRGALTLTNNAPNLDLVKLSNPEPIPAWFLGDLKYAVIFSRLDQTSTGATARQPYFLGAKLSLKPVPNVEFGLNMGKQFGGPGVDNSLGSTLRGIVGGTSADNTNNLAGFDLRVRIPALRNMELYGELSGEDSAGFWPIVESYVAGLFIPRLTADGRNDLRFEYFWGNQILYTNGTFPAGYLYKNMPLGHSQGGAAQDFFVRYSHWFSARQTLALEYIRTERGNAGRVAVNGVQQAVESKDSWRGCLTLPLAENLTAVARYGIEFINNLNLVGGTSATNQLFALDLQYRY